ncbi:hypothetical protein [Yinghuangia soli]|uniref:Uncharacterized protein n=1 Tax=Yinghuangia soli TaxID=2908204 RepID=A0AA41PYX6_9ACTN|nr:hypothetical protein [Yinghuangia soli]MCF2527022.1 hypothetical protein [Yinghuangia soli]
MDLELDPPNGVGALRIGMLTAEAHTALESFRDPAMPSASDAPGRHITRPSSLMISIGCLNGRLQAIELWRPETAEDAVLFRGINLFTLSAREVVETLRREVRIEANADDPASFVAPDLLLSFWRPFEADDNPDEEQGYYFNSVLLARPGYYDGPGANA